MRGAAIRPLSSLLIDRGRASMVSMRTLASGSASSKVEDLSQALSINASAIRLSGASRFLDM